MKLPPFIVVGTATFAPQKADRVCGRRKELVRVAALENGTVNNEYRKTHLNDRVPISARKLRNGACPDVTSIGTRFSRAEHQCHKPERTAVVECFYQRQ
jgi:hypothetical protein